MNKPTRFYSNRQETKVAKSLNGHKTANSGATGFVKGDVLTDKFLIECKTVTKEQKTFTVRKEWFEKNKKEALSMRKPYSTVVFDFGDGEQHYIISESLFKQLLSYLEEEN